MNKEQEKEFMNKLGVNIKYYRSQNNICLKEFAMKINLDIERLEQIEMGNYDLKIDELFLIAKVLEVKPSILCDFNYK